MLMETVVPLGAFAMLTISVALLTRLIATGMLNRTIREALRGDPGNVKLLADKLEQRQPWADALLGWIFLALAVAIVLLALFEHGEERMDMFQVAVVPLIIGVTVIAYVRSARGKTGA